MAIETKWDEISGNIGTSAQITWLHSLHAQPCWCLVLSTSMMTWTNSLPALILTLFICKPRAAAAAAKSLQSCPTLCDPIDGSPPGSPVPGILQARTLEWVAISFSNAWKWKVNVKSLSCVQLFATPWMSTGVGCHCLLLNQGHWALSLRPFQFKHSVILDVLNVLYQTQYWWNLHAWNSLF